MAEVTKRFAGRIGADDISEYTITDGDYSVSVIDYGATVTKLIVPDCCGRPTDVVLGYDTPGGYASGGAFFGATIGRVGNRIEKGFTLGGKFYPLCVNDHGANCLHGGERGFDKRMWQGAAEGGAVVMRRVSPDGEEGFPARLDVSVRFSLKKGSFSIDYEYVADGETPVGLTNHTYFNLNGQGCKDILNHSITINAGHYFSVDEKLIPSLPPVPVRGTAFDFSVPRKIGGCEDAQFEFTKYFDHAFLLNGGVAAHVCGDQSKIHMTVETDMPCVQFYCGNFVGGEVGKGGKAYGDYGGFCLETEYAPNAVNNGFHPACIAKANVKTHSRTSYIFD